MSMEDARDAAFAKAVKAGLIVQYPAPNELFLDIDSESDFKECCKRMKKFAEALGISRASYARSKSKNFHVYVEMKEEVELSNIGRIALQAVLGSDHKREALSLVTVSAGCERPTVFFSVPNNPKTAIEIDK